MNELQIKRTESGWWYITLGYETIHGGIATQREADSHLENYQKIYNAGVRKGISQK